MTRVFSMALIAATCSASLAAQQASAPARPADEGTRRTITLTGCVERGSTPNQFVIADSESGRFEVSGSQINKYLGQRVQVAGAPGSTRFRIKGGLWPTPNVAAQAGAMDPAQAAMAAQPGGPSSGTGEIGLPTFKVKSIRTLDGRCE